MTKLKIGLIIGTTRANRFADKPAEWLREIAAARDDMVLTTLDLRDFDLPLFDEITSEAYVPSQNPQAVAWQQTITGYDGFIVMTAEYNHSISGALKNALDQAYSQWKRKPMAAFGYGGTGGARAVEHLRAIAVELNMVPVRSAVHLGGGEILKVHNMGQDLPMSAVDDILRPSAVAMLDDLAWWARVLRDAKATEQALAA